MTSRSLTASVENYELRTQKILRPNEVEEVYGIKVGTLAKQRNQGNGLPYVVIGRAPKKGKVELSYMTKRLLRKFLNLKTRLM